MSRPFKLLIAMVAASVAACGGGQRPPPSPAAAPPAASETQRPPATLVVEPASDPNELLLARFAALTDAMCACKDVACAEGVIAELTATDDPGTQPTKPQIARAAQLAEQMAECHKALIVADAPPPGPGDGDGALAMNIVRAPDASDLDAYLAGVKGKGTLTATIETNRGTFHCALHERETPMTVANFIGLATGQKPWIDRDGVVQHGRRFYDGLAFHRVIPGFMIQGGDPLGSGAGGPGYQFADELVASLGHDQGGVLSMANSGPASNGSQFFITEQATPWLDGRHTIFGRCQERALVKKLTALAGPRDRPKKPITIKRVTFSRR